MTGVDQESLRRTARRIARRAGVGARRSTTPVALRVRAPRLGILSGQERGSPTVWTLCPDWDRPAGGIRKLYRAVDVLNEAGLPAAIVHERPGFACTWFEHNTRILSAADVAVGERDLILVPEVYGPTIRTLPAGVRQIIFNQNAYLTLESLAVGGQAAAAPYVDNPDLEAVLVVSEDNEDVLRYALPGAPITRVRHGLDSAIHHPPAAPAGRRIAFMPRRRPDEVAQVLRLLEPHGVLDRWELVPIERKSETEVSDLLRGSRIFLSFSEAEGFGLPPCEALACGCLVVGFDGFAGREFFRPPFAHRIEDGDLVAFARAVENLTRQIEEQPEAMAAASEAGSRFVLDRYSQAAERADLLGVIGPLLGTQG